ncbi:MAG: MFS transporter [Clostridiaceae bacterium]|nr:MFS transporter [Clostridiaceae bacterium]
MKEKKKMYYGWWIVFVGFLVYALVYSAISSAGVFTLPITEEFGFSRSAYSVRSLFASAGTIIGSFTVGRFIAKHNIKRTMIGSCMILIICVIGCTFCTQMWQFYAVSLLTGFGFAGATMIPVPVLINAWFGPKKKGLAMSIALAGSGIGGMFMTMVLNWFCQNYGWRAAYYANAVIFFAVVPFIAVLVIRSPKEIGLERIGEVLVDGAVSEKAGIPFSVGRKSMAYWLVAGSFFLLAFVNAGILNHQIPYFNDAGFTASKAASLGALALGALTLGKVLLGAMCDRIGIKKGVFVGNIMLMLSMLLIYMSADIHSMGYAYVVFYAIGGSVATVAAPLVVSAVFGDKEFSRYIGNINVATGIGNPIGAIFCGALFDATGGYGAAWIAMAAVSAVIIVMQIGIFNGKNKKPEAVAQV